MKESNSALHPERKSGEWDEREATGPEWGANGGKRIAEPRRSTRVLARREGPEVQSRGEDVGERSATPTFKHDEVDPLRTLAGDEVIAIRRMEGAVSSQEGH